MFVSQMGSKTTAETKDDDCRAATALVLLQERDVVSIERPIMG